LIFTAPDLSEEPVLGETDCDPAHKSPKLADVAIYATRLTEYNLPYGLM